MESKKGALSAHVVGNNDIKNNHPNGLIFLSHYASRGDFSADCLAFVPDGQ